MPAPLLFDTLKDVRVATHLEFSKRLAEQHHFCQLPSGKWCRTLGTPQNIDGNLVKVNANVWRQKSTVKGAA